MAQDNKNIFEFGNTKIDGTSFELEDFVFSLKQRARTKDYQDFRQTIDQISFLVVSNSIIDQYTGLEVVQMLGMLDVFKDIFYNGAKIVSETREIRFQKD